MTSMERVDAFRKRKDYLIKECRYYKWLQGKSGSLTEEQFDEYVKYRVELRKLQDIETMALRIYLEEENYNV